ncbi:MAG: hypothetical protein R3E48_23515 [Burkholderiaceae bacterium]
MCGIASISVRVKSSCEPCIRLAIMIEKPTPVATPATAKPVWRSLERTCVSAMSMISCIGLALASSAS